MINIHHPLSPNTWLKRIIKLILIGSLRCCKKCKKAYIKAYWSLSQTKVQTLFVYWKAVCILFSLLSRVMSFILLFTLLSSLPMFSLFELSRLNSLVDNAIAFEVNSTEFDSRGEHQLWYTGRCRWRVPNRTERASLITLLATIRLCL